MVVVGILGILATVWVVGVVAMHKVPPAALDAPVSLIGAVTLPLKAHTAATCGVLAQALFLTKYMKYTLDDKAKADLEAAWLERWSSKLGAPSRSPRTGMRAYLDDMNLSLDQLDAQMCWECWPSDDTPFEEVKLESA